ncbi:hypothetical protein [Dawidia soli]|uniref:O-antigen polymerase n=1 Tax=Dawidia soli TaxID=2782352 RepID=A0AAP2GKT6_9BACT|nr:hypothetical protein [Dawidia soli]MBT1690801.1 hypothetical protein [Dawidia soli]
MAYPSVLLTKFLFLILVCGILTVAALDSSLYYCNLAGYLFIFIVPAFLVKDLISRMPLKRRPSIIEALYVGWCIIVGITQTLFVKQLGASALMTLCSGLFIVTCTKEWAGKMLGALFTATLLLCTYFLADYYYHLLAFKQTRDIIGIFYNSGPFSIFVSLFWPLALIRYCRGYKVQASLYFGLTLLLLSITLSRTSIGIAFLSTAAFFLTRIKAKHLVGAIALLIFTSAFLFWLKPTSVIGRLCVWKVTSGLFLKNRTWGVGLSNFTNAYNSYKATVPEELCSEFLDKVDYPFNEPIKIFVEGGVISGAFLTTIALLTFNSLSRRRGRYNAKLAIAAAIVPPFLFSYPLSSLPLSLVIVCYLVILKPNRVILKPNRVILKPNRVILKPNRRLALTQWHAWKVKTCIVLVLIALLSCLYPAFKQIRTEIDLSNFLYEYANPEIPRSIVFENNAHLRQHPIFAAHHGKYLVNSGRYKEAIAVNEYASNHIADPMLLCTLAEALSASAMTSEAEIVLQRAIWMAPKRIYPRFQLFKLYLAIGDNKQARDIGGIILSRTEGSKNVAAVEMRQFVLAHL